MAAIRRSNRSLSNRHRAGDEAGEADQDASDFQIAGARNQFMVALPANKQDLVRCNSPTASLQNGGPQGCRAGYAH
jgi:hypothetical protein